MHDTDRMEVKQEVGRILAENELEVRRLAMEELREHRQYLQSQFKTAASAIVALALIAGGIFTYFYGKSFDRITESMEREIEEKVVEYRLVEAFNERLQARLDLLVESDQTTMKIKQSLENRLRADLARLTAQEVARATGAKTDQELEAIVTEAVRGILGQVVRRQERTARSLAVVITDRLDELGDREPARQARLQVAACDAIDREIDYNSLTCTGLSRYQGSEGLGRR